MGKVIETYTTYEASTAIAAIAALGFGLQISQPILNPGQGVLMGLTKLTVVQTTAVSSTLALGAADTTGTDSTSLAGRKVSQGGGGYVDSSGRGRLVTAWSVAPTINASAGVSTYLRQEILPATIGAGFEWTWPEDDPFTNGLSRVGVGLVQAGLLLRNIGAAPSAALLVSARWIEFSPSEQ